jgi:hypothetical protein
MDRPDPVDRLREAAISGGERAQTGRCAGCSQVAFFEIVLGDHGVRRDDCALGHTVRCERDNLMHELVA